MFLLENILDKYSFSKVSSEILKNSSISLIGLSSKNSFIKFLILFLIIFFIIIPSLSKVLYFCLRELNVFLK